VRIEFLLTLKRIQYTKSSDKRITLVLVPGPTDYEPSGATGLKTFLCNIVGNPRAKDVTEKIIATIKGVLEK
jgi:hypothetical protein